MVQGFTSPGKEFGVLFCCHGEPLKGFIQGSVFSFKKIALTPEWLMGWRGKERIKETNQEITAVLRVRSDTQEDLVVLVVVK